MKSGRLEKNMIRPFQKKEIPAKSRLLIITEKMVNDQAFYMEFLLDADRKTVFIHAEAQSHKLRLGSLYCGRIERVLTSPRAAFLNLGDAMAYLPIRKDMPLFYMDKQSKKDFSKGEGLAQGDSLLVSIDKEAVRTKEAVLTSQFTIKSSHLIYAFGRKGLHFAKAIRKDQKREVEECFQALSPDSWDGSITLRTNAKGLPADLLLKEAGQLLDHVRELEDLAKCKAAPGLVEEAEPHYMETFLHEADAFDYVRTDLLDVYEALKSKAEEAGQPELLEKIDFYQDDFPLSNLYSLTRRLEDASQRMVHLKSGGNLVIEKTEACYVIDVNTAQALKTTAFDLNSEAMETAMQQIRLRNLSGIILVDLMKMKTEEERKELVDLSKKLAEKDPVPVRIYGITALGLLEMTREKREATLREQMELKKF